MSKRKLEGLGLMEKEGLQSKIRKQRKVTINSSNKYPVAPNLLAQNFTVSRANEVWVPDITYLKTKKGWMYFTVTIDFRNRAVVGWILSNTIFAKYRVIAAWKPRRNDEQANSKKVEFNE